RRTFYRQSNQFRFASGRGAEAVAELDEVGLVDVAVVVVIKGRRGTSAEGVAEGDEVGLVHRRAAVAVAVEAEILIGVVTDVMVVTADDGIVDAVKRTAGAVDLVGVDRKVPIA